jgi:hypothetical protein
LDLKLANDVVYAILGTIGFIFLIVYITRIVRLRAEQPRTFAQTVYTEQPPDKQDTAPWPVIPQEQQK